MSERTAGRAQQISNEAVRAATGKTWPEWFKLLDAAGARKMDHKQIVAYIERRHKMSGWWEQMVTVAYEQSRGLRNKHQKPSGYEISGSKTIDVPVAILYSAFDDARIRSQWLRDGAGLVIRKATPNKSMRITWVEGRSSVSVNFYAKGDRKTQVSVQHGKLPDTRAASRMKAYWAESLERLKNALEKQQQARPARA